MHRSSLALIAVAFGLFFSVATFHTGCGGSGGSPGSGGDVGSGGDAGSGGSTGLGGSAGSGGDTCGSFGFAGTTAASCEACYDTNCCSQALGCSSVQDCLDYLRCRQTCATTDCATCRTDFPTGAALDDTLVQCLLAAGPGGGVPACTPECSDARVP
jgi:hypothetical protein